MFGGRVWTSMRARNSWGQSLMVPHTHSQGFFPGTPRDSHNVDLKISSQLWQVKTMSNKHDICQILLHKKPTFQDKGLCQTSILKPYPNWETKITPMTAQSSLSASSMEKQTKEKKKQKHTHSEQESKLQNIDWENQSRNGLGSEGGDNVYHWWRSQSRKTSQFKTEIYLEGFRTLSLSTFHHINRLQQ